MTDQDPLGMHPKEDAEPSEAAERLSPGQSADVTAATYGQILGQLGSIDARLERVIKDVEAQGSKLDDLSHRLSFARGAFWAGVAVISVVVTVFGGILSTLAWFVYQNLDKLVTILSTPQS